MGSKVGVVLGAILVVLVAASCTTGADDDTNGPSPEPSFDGFRFPRFDIEGPCPGPNLDPLVDQHGLLTALGLGARPVLVGDELHLLWAPLWTDQVAFVFEEASGA